jgi:chromosome segregation ATPase
LLSAFTAMSDGRPATAPVRKTLVERQADATGNDPMARAESIIVESEKSSVRLRAQREKTADNIVDCDRRVAELQFEIDTYTKMRNDVQSNLDFRVSERDRIVAKLAESKEKKDELMADCKDWAAKMKRTEYKNLSTIAKGTLQAERGYTTEAGSTMTRKDVLRRTQVLSGRLPPPSPGAGGAEAAAAAAIRNAQGLLGGKGGSRSAPNL